MEKYKDCLESPELKDWSAYQVNFDALLSMPNQNVQDLQDIISKWAAIEAELDELEAVIHIRAHQDVNDQSRQDLHTQHVETIEPNKRKAENAVRQKILSSPALAELRETEPTFIRILEAMQRLFRQENIDLLAQESIKTQEYTQVVGKLTATWKEETLSLPQAISKLGQYQRDDREKLWRAVWDSRLQKADELDDVLDSLVSQRHQIAINAGFENYIDYCFLSRLRFDYSPADCLTFHEAIAKVVKPVADKVYLAQKDSLAVSSLRPWDLSCARWFEFDVTADNTSNDDFKTDSLAQTTEAILHEISPQFAIEFKNMIANGEMDLLARKGKGPGAFQYRLAKRNRPYIVMNASGTADDVTVLLHEFGHALHSILAAPRKHFDHLITSEIAEIASMAMESFALQHIGKVLPQESALNLKTYKHKRELLFFVYCAQVDAFQHWIYQHPKASPKERRSHWADLCTRFGPPIDWSGIEEYKDIYWQQQVHIFAYPFYYIDYAIAQLGALRLAQNYSKDPASTLEQYQNALALGSSKTLPELYNTAGIPFDFGIAGLKPIIEGLEKEIL